MPQPGQRLPPDPQIVEDERRMEAEARRQEILAIREQMAAARQAWEARHRKAIKPFRPNKDNN